MTNPRATVEAIRNHLQEALNLADALATTDEGWTTQSLIAVAAISGALDYYNESLAKLLLAEPDNEHRDQ